MAQIIPPCTDPARLLPPLAQPAGKVQTAATSDDVLGRARRLVGPAKAYELLYTG
jgi:hypothetical protein